MNQNKNLYFVSPYIDGAMIGGISVAVFIYYQFFFQGYSAFQVSSNALFMASLLSWFVNFPHFAATNYQLYQSKENLKRYPFTAIILPFLIFAGIIICFLSPVGLTPLIVKLFIVWSPFHYTGQNLGITMIYARRANIRIEKGFRFALSGFLYSSFITQYSELETQTGSLPFFGVSFPLFGIPHWIPKVALGFTILFGLALLFFSMQWMRRNSRFIPWIVTIPALSQLIWTILGARNFSFQALLPIFHGLQYLLLAWSIQIAVGANKVHEENRAKFLATTSLKWMIINILGGAILFYAVPRSISRLGWDLAFCNAVFFVAFQLHHFIIDGVIWRLRGASEKSALFLHYSEILKTRT